MSQENVIETGRLLCAIPNAGESTWTLRGVDLLLYERALATRRVTIRETWGATIKHQLTLRGSRNAQMKRLARKADQPIRELLAERPANLLVPKAEIREIGARWGSRFSTLHLTLHDGREWEWKYGSWYAPAFEEIEAAIQQLRDSTEAGLRE
jgi:hypothetical protein